MIAIYLRVSQESQDHAAQRHAVMDWMAKHRTDQPFTEFCDTASGKSFKSRTEFDRMLCGIKSGQYTTLVCYRLDRLSRDSSAAIRLILDLDDMGCEFVAVAQPIFSTDQPFRKVMIALFAELAQMEREILVERTKAGLEAARAKGKRLGRPREIDNAKETEVWQLREAGLSERKIAAITGISRASVRRILAD